MNLNGTSDLRRAELEDLVKAANGDDAKLASDAKFEITLRQLKAIQTGATLGRAESLVKSGRPDPRPAMARALRTHAVPAPIVKASKGKGDLSGLSIPELKTQAMTGSQSERTAALCELGLRCMTGVADEPASAPAAQSAPAASAPAPATAAPVAKSAAQRKAYWAYLEATKRIAATHEATGKIPPGMTAELKILKQRAGL